MKIEKVRKLTPIERLTYWITERESIRLKREAGEPRPWTDDSILNTYRFTNVRRMDDRVSQWLLNNWYIPYKDHKNILPAIALARFVNKPSSLGFVGFPTKWNAKSIKQCLRHVKEHNPPVFNAAYMVRGNDGEDKISSVVDYYVQPLVDNPPTIHKDSMELTHGELMQYHGMGSFMSGQICADLRWAMTGTWLDKNDWAPIGTGSMKGMNLLQGREMKASLRQEQFLRELQMLVKLLRGHLPKSITDRLEMCDYQSCCCEIFKYSKALLGLGFPKQLFRSIK